MSSHTASELFLRPDAVHLFDRDRLHALLKANGWNNTHNFQYDGWCSEYWAHRSFSHSRTGNFLWLGWYLDPLRADPQNIACLAEVPEDLLRPADFCKVMEFCPDA